MVKIIIKLREVIKCLSYKMIVVSVDEAAKFTCISPAYRTGRENTSDVIEWHLQRNKRVKFVRFSLR